MNDDEDKIKVVINCKTGGFGLSHAAIWTAKQLWDVAWGEGMYPVRHDPRLVELVENMGAAANGDNADLAVVRLQSNCYFIHVYKGLEWVFEPEDIYWTQVAEHNLLEYCE